MEIRVVVPDETGVGRLMNVLARVWDAPSVSYDSGCNEVRVLTKRDSNRLVVQVLAAVQEWLADECIGWAKLWLGFRSYTLVGSTPRSSGE